jgi:hypothetical protein
MGHEGIQKTLHWLCASFFMPHDLHWVCDFIKGCIFYQRHKTEHLHPVGLLQLLDVPSMVWQDIAMDFVNGFLKVGGKAVILTIVDRLSKYAHFIALAHPYTAMTIAAAFIEQIVLLHGVPASIISDRDPVCTSTVWQEIFHLCGTMLRTSSTFRPHTDGQSEVMNQIITVYLRFLVGDHPKSWLRWLP